jgi:hypothetical protein
MLISLLERRIVALVFAMMFTILAISPHPELLSSLFFSNF